MIDTVSDRSIQKHTGKIWKDWVETLNTEGAPLWSFQEIKTHLKKKHRQTTWWQVIIANGYEVAIGRRLSGQSLKGTYSTTLTKTLPVSNTQVWNWCCSEEGQKVWLKPFTPVAIAAGESFEIEGGTFGEIRTLKKGRRLRLRWIDPDYEKPSHVQLQLNKLEGGKCMIVISHDGLMSARHKTAIRAHWEPIVEAIAVHFAQAKDQPAAKAARARPSLRARPAKSVSHAKVKPKAKSKAQNKAKSKAKSKAKAKP